MSKRDWTGAMIGVLVMTGTLAAQPGPDPLASCRNRASALVNVPVSGISAMKRGTLDNGNLIIWWDAKLTSSHTVSGFCEASPLNGRVVRLGTNRTDSMKDARSPYRITLDDAERVCQKEARARFSPGNGLLGARILYNISTRSIYRVAWQYDSMYRTIRKGQCDIDSYTGNILKFHAERVW